MSGQGQTPRGNSRNPSGPSKTGAPLHRPLNNSKVTKAGQSSQSQRPRELSPNQVRQALQNNATGSRATFGSAGTQGENRLSNANNPGVPMSASGVSDPFGNFDWDNFDWSDFDRVAVMNDGYQTQLPTFNPQVPQQQQQQQQQYGVNDIESTLAFMSMSTPAYAFGTITTAASPAPMQPQTSMDGTRGNDDYALGMDNNAITGATAPMGTGFPRQSGPTLPRTDMQNSGYQFFELGPQPAESENLSFMANSVWANNASASPARRGGILEQTQPVGYGNTSLPRTNFSRTTDPRAMGSGRTRSNSAANDQLEQMRGPYQRQQGTSARRGPAAQSFAMPQNASEINRTTGFQSYTGSPPGRNACGGSGGHQGALPVPQSASSNGSSPFRSASAQQQQPPSSYMPSEYQNTPFLRAGIVMPPYTGQPSTSNMFGERGGTENASPPHRSASGYGPSTTRSFPRSSKMTPKRCRALSAPGPPSAVRQQQDISAKVAIPPNIPRQPANLEKEKPLIIRYRRDHEGGRTFYDDTMNEIPQATLDKIKKFCHAAIHGSCYDQKPHVSIPLQNDQIFFLTSDGAYRAAIKEEAKYVKTKWPRTRRGRVLS